MSFLIGKRLKDIITADNPLGNVLAMTSYLTETLSPFQDCSKSLTPKEEWKASDSFPYLKKRHTRHPATSDCYNGKDSGSRGLWCFFILVTVSFWARVTLTPQRKVTLSHFLKPKAPRVHMSRDAYCKTTKPHQNSSAAQEGGEAVGWTNSSPLPGTPPQEGS